MSRSDDQRVADILDACDELEGVVRMRSEGEVLERDTLNEHARDTQGVDGHSSIDAAPAGVLEVSTWSTRSAASMNDVDTDERQLIMARQGRALSSSR